MSTSRVLIVDDEEGARFGMSELLRTRGYEVEEADSCARAEERFRHSPPDVAILDHQLTDGTALDLLPRLRSLDASVPLAILTGHASIDLAVKAVKLGADQFLIKPVELQALVAILERMLENRRNQKHRLAQEVLQLKRSLDPFVGTSPVVRCLAEEATRIVASDRPVLIHGETGSGKGVLARWLHENGSRAHEPFVDLNCASLAPELVESELFGHERGAFTGAVARKAGLLELANHGTVFLDEIGDLGLQVQPRLLKVLEDKRFRRVGGVYDRQLEIRLISATHQELAEAARAGTFRSDLFYRINTIILRVPPLRERVEDIPILARDILDRALAEMGRRATELAPDAVGALSRYAWPGNVRELRNVLERAVLLCTGDTITPRDLRFEAAAEPTARDMPPASQSSLTLADVERAHIVAVLEEENGHVGRAALRLGVPRSSLYQRIARLGIVVPKS